MPFFVNDLIPLILEANDHWWPNDLAVLSRLSSPWLYHARRRLYPCPTVYSFKAAILLADSLSANPQLASLVRALTFKPTSTSRFHPTEFKALRFLLGLDGLSQITLAGQLSVRAERFLRLISNPESVQELHIDGSLVKHCFNTQGSLEWDESIAFSFPNLTKLRLTHTELDIIPPSIPYVSPITYLTLDNVHIVNGYLPHLLHGITALERLHITTSDPDASGEQIRLVLASCTLGCLHYEVQKDNKGDSFVLDTNQPSAVSLRCLHLQGLFVDLGVLTLVDEICKNLVELVVSGRAVRVSPYEWAEFIKSGAFSSLERLGLPWGTNNPPFLAWPPSAVEEIKKACSSRKTPLILH